VLTGGSESLPARELSSLLSQAEAASPPSFLSTRTLPLRVTSVTQDSNPEERAFPQREEICSTLTSLVGSGAMPSISCFGTNFLPFPVPFRRNRENDPEIECLAEVGSAGVNWEFQIQRTIQGSYSFSSLLYMSQDSGKPERLLGMLLLSASAFPTKICNESLSLLSRKIDHLKVKSGSSGVDWLEGR
jgi:hypothetical protein